MIADIKIEKYFRKLLSFTIMKNLIQIILGLMLLVTAEKGLSQKDFLHLTYKPTSCVVIDSTFAFEEYDMDEVLSSVAGFDSLDVFITPKYFAKIAYNTNMLMHTVYNRKTRMIRRHITYLGRESFWEDSVMFFLHKDKKLRRTTENLKDSLGIREYRHVQKTIHGIKCHLITHPVYSFFSDRSDSVWVADFKDIPELIQPGFGFIISGIPFQYEVNNGLWSVWVESEIKPETDLPDYIFNIDPGLSEIQQLQTQDKIPDYMTYLRKNRT